MNKPDHNLEVYQAISLLTGQMVDAARASDWDGLVALEQDCRDLIGSLKHAGEQGAPDAALSGTKVALIRKALADDAQVRNFTEAWMTRLESYLGNARQAYRLQSAYQTDVGR
jgi:flagellar protein FliT